MYGRCIWEDCDQEACYCEGHAKEYADPLNLVDKCEAISMVLIDALDLVPRINDDDPMAPALAEWCRSARSALAKAGGER